METILRAYRSEDRDAVLALVGEVLGEHGFAANVEAVRHDLDEGLDRYGGSTGGFWVAERDGSIVGTVAIRPKEGARSELKRLYVRSTARGEGLGQRLYSHAESFARRAGYRTIWLDSSRRFEQARRLYERNGFVLVEEIDNDWEDNVYEKRL